MQENRLSPALYGPKTALRPRLRTDRLFQLPGGSARFAGALADAIRFITKEQLMDTALWRLLANQFRSNVDDVDHGWRCEYWGKLMRGASFVYGCTQDAALYAVMEDTVRDLLGTQDAEGRFSTYSKEVEFHGWDIWGRKYILLGLQYFLEVCRDEALKAQILSALERHADYILAHIGPAEEGKLEINLATDHWLGLNSSSLLEPIVRLYSLTGKARYLEFADYIVGRGGVSQGNVFELAYVGRLYPYQYPATKAYEMMSCFDGLLEYYRVTGLEKWRVAVENFARLTAQSDITLIGCAGCTHELFDHSAVRQLDVTEKGIMQETCVTVTWMKLCYQLLSLTGDSFFADRMEQSLYNALLGAVNSEKCQTNHGLPFDSYSPLLPGLRGRKTGGLKAMENGAFYGCCAAIGAAGLGLFGLAAALESEQGVTLNWYMPGSVQAVTPQGQPLTLFLDTQYPAAGEIRVTVRLPRPERFEIALRIPAWSHKASLRVNGEEISRVFAGNYKPLSRLWQEGDQITLTLDMRVERILPEVYGVSSQDAPFIAFRRGPLVLARDARLGQEIDAPAAPLLDEGGYAQGEAPLAAPFPCQFACALPDAQGGSIALVDYASAGKTWDERSRMAAWIPAAR